MPFLKTFFLFTVSVNRYNDDIAGLAPIYLLFSVSEEVCRHSGTVVTALKFYQKVIVSVVLVFPLPHIVSLHPGV